MKRLAVLIALAISFPVLSSAQVQRWVTVYPYPNNTIVDSARVATTTDTVYTYRLWLDSLVTVHAGDSISTVGGGTPFAGVLSGMRIYGLDSACWVWQNEGDSLLIIAPDQGDNDSVSITLRKPEAGFITVVAGYPVHGAQFYNGTSVLAGIDSFSFRVDKKPSGTSTNATVAHGSWDGVSAPYTSGDLVGIPFFFQAPNMPQLVLDAVVIVDSNGQAQNLDVVLYNDAVITYAADNGGVAPGAASYDNALLSASVTTFKVLGSSTSIGYATSLNFPLTNPPNGWFYGMVVARGTGDYKGNKSLQVRLGFK